MSSRVVIWAILALVVGVAAGYYFGYSSGYDQAANFFLASK
ncbi:MAG: hypothetical protein NTY12_05570 [Candidatus Falkowbacteria bacterium]|nr:hypothetical protein [Candidatus Falkowbacteria bacterium]